MEDKIRQKIDTYFSQFQRHSYPKNEIIIYPDEQPASAFYIKSGYIREYNISIEGVEITIHLFAPYSFFPMTWVIGDIKNRYYYEALTNSEVYSIPKDSMKAFLKENPDVLYNLTQRLLQGLDKLTLRIEQLTYGKAHTRLVSTLFLLSRHFGKPVNNSVTITEKFTHREIAAFAGITRETASREWEKLHQKGILIYDSNQHIVIPNLTKLQEELVIA